MTGAEQPDWALSWSGVEDLMNAGSFKLPTPISNAFICFDERTAELSLEIDIAISSEPNLLPQAVSFRFRNKDDERRTLIAACMAPDLNRHFYMFLVDVLGKIRNENLEPIAAIEFAWRTWGQLLEQQTVLSQQKQVGLIGELWLLSRLAKSMGWSNAVAAWHDEGNSEHDFCLPSADIEVKSTTLEARVHTIGSANQLVPSPSRTLLILSLQFTPSTGLAQGAVSLRSAVSQIRQNVMEDGVEAKFVSRLSTTGWREDHAAYYGKTYVFRSAPTLVPVDASCPRITPEFLAVLPNDLEQRIKSVLYSIDLTGLGWPENDERFKKLVP